jgi:hypothetical protein
MKFVPFDGRGDAAAGPAHMNDRYGAPARQDCRSRQCGLIDGEYGI